MHDDAEQTRTAAAPINETAQPTDDATTHEPVVDELADDPRLSEVLGKALPKLEIFHTKLMEEGEPRGLIGPRDVSIVWERHILNSAAIVPFVRKATQGRQFKTVADVGSGGGFPGIVAAACLPDHRFTLIEPMERRIAWLEECVDEMGLRNVTLVRARSEEAIAALNAHGYGSQPKRNDSRARGGRTNLRQQAQQSHTQVSRDVYDAIAHPFAVVTCRAVAPMTKLSGWTLPLLAPHGELIALKGRSAAAEIEKASKVIKQFGGTHARVVEAEVAPGLEPTHVVIVDKR